jgi:hypothetical protein
MSHGDGGMVAAVLAPCLREVAAQELHAGDLIAQTLLFPVGKFLQGGSLRPCAQCVATAATAMSKSAADETFRRSATAYPDMAGC